VFDFAAGKEGKGTRGHTLSPAKRPTTNWQGGATPLPSPLGKKAAEPNERERRTEGVVVFIYNPIEAHPISPRPNLVSWLD